VQADKTWLDRASYKMANVMAGIDIGEAIDFLVGITSTGESETVNISYVTNPTPPQSGIYNNSIFVVYGTLSALSEYATLTLRTVVGAQPDYARQVYTPPISRPTNFALEVEWRNTLNFTEADDDLKNRILELSFISAGYSWDFNTMRIVHSTGTASVALYDKGYETVASRRVVYFKGSYPAGIEYSNIGTVIVSGTCNAYYPTTASMWATITPFTKPIDAELLIEFRTTIDIAI